MLYADGPFWSAVINSIIVLLLLQVSAPISAPLGQVRVFVKGFPSAPRKLTLFLFRIYALDYVRFELVILGAI